MDYKNTPEGRAVQNKYGKILHASRPEPPRNHPRMPMSNRAKIFSPFAALRGYEDEIASEGRDHLKGNRIELSEEGKEVLNQKISQLWKGQEITIKYFTDGYYENVAGVLAAMQKMQVPQHECALHHIFQMHCKKLQKKKNSQLQALFSQ